MKMITQTLLLLLVLAGLGYWAWGNIAPTPSASSATNRVTVSPDLTLEHVVVVTYFTTDVRCKSCLQIESLTRLTLDEQFAQELESGAVYFQTLNLDQPENKQFIRDYYLPFKTVLISEFQNGEEARWRKMDKVWEFLSEPETFENYLAEQIREYLES